MSIVACKGEEIIDYSLINSRMEKFREEQNLDWQSILERRNDFEKSSVKVNFIYNLIYNIINIIVPLLTAPYTSRVLGAANIGIYSYTYSIVSSMILFGALGTATYGQREIAAAGDDIEKRSRLFWEIWILKAIATIVIFIFFLSYAITTKYCLYYLLQIPFFVAAILDISYLFQGLENSNILQLETVWFV